MSDSLQEQPFMAHLLELRDRLLRMVLAVLILLLILFPFGNDIFTLLSQPVADALPEGQSMIATKVLSPFLTPLKLAFVAALFLAMPFLLYQLWSFIAPGLYQHEKRLAVPMLASSVMLFYMGAAFAYFVVLPLLFPFLVGVVPENVEVAPDIADFLDVAIKLFFAFGLAFEVPIATILLVIARITTPQKLAEKRPYIIVGAFVVGMLLTPPDVISQTLLAVPIWILFELGLVFSRMFLRNRDKRRAEAEAEATTAGSQATATTGTAAAAGSDNIAGETLYEGEGDDDPDWTPVKVDVPEDYRPLSEAEMDAELDALDDDDEEDEEADDSGNSSSSDQWQDDPEDDFFDTIVDKPEESTPQGGQVEVDAEPEADEPSELPRHQPDAVDDKLEQVMALRHQERYDEARTLLYEVLAEGSETQVKVARNILSQLDS